MELQIDMATGRAEPEPLLRGEAPDGTDDLTALRRLLKIETERLKFRHRAGLPGMEAARRRSDLVDQVVLHACRMAAERSDPFLRAELGVSGCALVALGGYGRRELAPGSDVDLLFLRHARSASVKGFVGHVLHLLWDAGLSVGHSFRSVAECVDIARRDITARTSMAEARLVSGSAPLFAELVRSLDELVAKRASATAEYLDGLERQLEERHARFGRTVALQEPSVKESPGGLRDLHAVLWAARARFGLGTLEELRDAGRLAPSEYRALRRAADFLWRVRNEAHFTTGRRSDVLTLDLQPELARALGFTSRRGLQASEIFMRDYYRQADTLRRLCGGFLVRASSRLAGGLQSPARPRRHGSLAIRAGRLWPTSSDGEFRGGARQVLEAFAVAQAGGLDLSDELKLALRGSVHRIDARFRASVEAARAFTRIIGRPGRVGAALRQMHETGVLGRLLPEFARVTFLVQHDSYHRYTVDEHSLRAVEVLDEVASGSEIPPASFRRVFDGVRHPVRLYLGTLLHDIGKGRGGGHVPKGVAIAERVCRRLRLPREAAEDVLFLVRCHLILSHLSQRRDLTDPAVVAGLVAEVGTLDRLDMLLLLTYADHRAVGPDVWNDWRGGLLWDLYERARRHLSGAEDRPIPECDAKEEAVAALAAESPRSVLERHFALMPPRYLRTATAPEMVRHFCLLQRLQDGPLVVQWQTLPDRLYTELTIAARDARGLVARLAGTLSAHNLDLLSVDAYTREDGVVLDTFRLCAQRGAPVRPERWEPLEKKLRAAVEGRLDVAAAVEAWRARTPRRRRHLRRSHPVARFDPQASAAYSVLEVRADDEPGLVYAIASTLSGLGLDIAFAAIATEKSQAFDVFYLTDAEGRKLDAERMRTVEDALRGALREVR
jgi:[protein-PII] uridylyltransferase